MRRVLLTLALLGAIAVAGFGGVYLDGTLPAPEGQVRSSGLDVKIVDPQWGGALGHSSLKVKLEHVGVTRWRRLIGPDSLDNREVIDGLCQALVEHPPKPPLGLTEAPLYRVEIQITQRFSPVGQPAISVAVRDQRCDPDGTDDLQHVPYPSPLDQWLPYDATMSGEYPRQITAVRFFRRDKAGPPLESFDRQAACEALLSDPPQGMRELLYAHGPASHQVGVYDTVPRLLFYTTGIEQSFYVAGKGCVILGPERKA